MKTTNAGKRLGPNPISAIDITHGRTLGEWHRLWDSTTNVTDLIALLHEGFSTEVGKSDVPAIQEVQERIIFYLRCADGWQEGTIPRSESLRVSERNRGLVMKKAFDMLASAYFSRVVEDDRAPFFTYTNNGRLYDHKYYIPELLPYLTDFFGRVNERGRFQLRNFRTGTGGSHAEKVTQQFLRKLVSRLLCIIPERYKSGAHLANELLEAHCWAIEVLNALGEIETVLEYNQWLVSGSYVKLKEIAFRTDTTFVGNEQDPPVRWSSLREPLTAGRPIAWVLHRLETTNGMPSSFCF